MKVKVSEASEQVLDWMVAKALGWKEVGSGQWMFNGKYVAAHLPSFHRMWSEGGPILERKDIATFPASFVTGKVWCAVRDPGGTQPMELNDLDNRPAWWFEEKEVMKGSTKLIAGLRCYVVSELGEEVEVPDELVRA